MRPGHASSSPAVSVVVPAFNVAPYVAETLASVLAQTFTDFEAIVINDGSTDDTERAIEPFRSRIVYVEQANRGLGGARNAGVAVARGKYVALLDADDVWMPGYLTTLVGMLEKDPQLDVAFPNAVLFGDPYSEGRLFQDDYPALPPITMRRLLRRECFVFVSAVFRRKLIDEVGLFDETLERAEDLDLWLRAAERGARFGSTAEPLVRYRQRKDSLSHDEVSMLHSLIEIYEKTRARLPAAAPEQPDIEAMLSELHIRIDAERAHLTLGGVRRLLRRLASRFRVVA